MQTQASKSPLYLVDGSSYLYRAYFAIRQPLTTSTGFPTKVIFGVTNMLLKIIREKQPEFMAIAWDAKGPTFRHDLYEEYKANRPPMPDDLSVQIPYVRRVVEALGLPQLEVEGYEADDIIATLVKGMPRQPIIIVSGDKDLLQLVSERVTIWDPMKDEIIDEDAIRQRFGIDPPRLLDVMALSGDTSDNIPGVPGVGPKTALKLIKAHGSLEHLVENMSGLPKNKLKERLIANKDRLSLWKTLVALAFDVPVPTDLEYYRVKPPDQSRLRKLFEELEFSKFLKDLVPGRTISFESYRLVQSEEDLKGLVDNLLAAKRLVIDTETTSEQPMLAELVGISICFNPPEAFYLPVGHKTDRPQLSLETVKKVLAPVLSQRAGRIVGQNIKYDLIVLANHGIVLDKTAGDTMIASYLLNPTQHQHNLMEIAKEILGHKMISFKEVTANQKRVKNFAFVPLELAKDYSCEDAHVTFLVMEELWKRLRQARLWDLFEGVEVPLIQVLVHMEMAGIMVDKEGLSELSKEFRQRLRLLKKEIYALAGEEFNVNSTKQLAKVLFERLKLPQKKRTKKKTGFSTDVEVLSELSSLHPLPGKILEYRNLSKLKSTYVEGLKRVINPQTGRVHSSFNQTVTATGRLSSSDPNLQNIPIRTEEGRRIRRIFIAPKGHFLLSADYSQIDLRVLAHFSQDDALINAFKQGKDIHSLTAAEVFGCPQELVTPEMRRVAKTVNFGIIYGMSMFGLAKELGISRRRAREFIDRYFEKYPGVRAYMDRIVQEARRDGYVTTLLGRRRYIPDIRSRVKNVREFAERTAINTPIQGSAADIIKLAMLRIFKRIKGDYRYAKMLLQVHDELVFEVPEQHVKELASMVKNEMENAAVLAIPLTVSIGWGRNWAEIGDK